MRRGGDVVDWELMVVGNQWGHGRVGLTIS